LYRLYLEAIGNIRKGKYVRNIKAAEDKMLEQEKGKIESEENPDAEGI
jgi:hypothetical protein